MKLTALLLPILLLACTSPPAQTEKPTTLPPANATNYWYQGLAELSSYTVEQERYGEMRQAEQVNVFVTEDFSAAKHVKLDNPEAAGADRVPVLKLNAIRRYQTGIYDYSMMMSVFTPTQGTNRRPLKTTCTIQDWCGHAFTQTDASSDGVFRVRQFSYFETEGDTDELVNAALSEDGLWTQLRLDPASLNGIETTLLPPAFYSRLYHKPYQAQKAQLNIKKGEKESTLHVVYSDIPRKLDIRFETAAPYRILGWTETDGDKLLSRGTLKKTMMSDYWAKNDNASAGLRDSLKMGF